MGLEDAASAARLKVSAALLPSLRDAPRTAAQRFHLDAPGWFREPQTPQLLPAVAEAVWDDRPVAVRYRRGEEEVARVLEPYGLVLKAGVWYVCARVADVGSFRTYRIDRFTAVEPGEGRFTRDEEFDLPGFWQAQAERFARSLLRAEVVVRLSPAGVRALPYAVDPLSARDALETAGDPDVRGRVTVTLRVESEEVAHTQITALGPEAEVLSPASLRERFTGDARRLAELYDT
jgi:predicted DNA-binding transcriptional regulator YafY